MKPTLNQIETFFWIARLQGFQAAAEELGLSQPTVSLRIRDLEHAVGSKLFERSGRRVRLTQAGEDLLPEAERIIDMAGRFAWPNGAADQLHGKLRIGGSDSFGAAVMPSLLSELSRTNPEVSVAMTIDNSLVLSDRLSRRELDLAFLVEPEVENHVRVELIGAMTNVWVAGPHVIIPDGVVTPAVLAPYHIVTNPTGSMLMRIVRLWFNSAGLQPLRLSTCNSLPIIVNLALRGEVVSFLPMAIVAEEIAAKRLRMLNTAPSVPEPKLFAAFQAEKDSPSLQKVIAKARALCLQAGLVNALDHPPSEWAAQ